MSNKNPFISISFLFIDPFILCPSFISILISPIHHLCFYAFYCPYFTAPISPFPYPPSLPTSLLNPPPHYLIPPYLSPPSHIPIFNSSPVIQLSPFPP
ncbi:hypothetical protein NBO_41g0022 [Nosema bombycis CQ1]|uniref:Uncharacterized protein n=1 Tax=Nosema bombycis (strain CQ1 / CVCC 102059) TaxID=578461 RepID=R0KTB0_NOSB1|nr:hypothetical protein NBO_41g0022 [Nosema bombycis CQ1]|eukprot:EOB14046.1 hypothetical protein NBO_41g0022 [Nosema bombycis CQ1]